jgi:hypothetical protein
MKDLNINMGIVITYIFGVRSVEPVVPEEFAHIVSTKHSPPRLFVTLYKLANSNVVIRNNLRK